jgi:hypothetical protein
MASGTNGTSGNGIYLYSHLTGVSYEIDSDKWLFQLLPPKFSKGNSFKYIRCIFNALNTFHNRFLKERVQYLKEIRITGQKMILEKWLNDYFKTEGIVIINGNSVFTNTYLYQMGESGDVDDDTFLYQQGETPLSDQVYLFTIPEAIPDFDFKVEVPSQLINSGVSVREIEAVVDRYKYMGVTYEVLIV